MQKQLNRKYSASQAINSSLMATMLAFASIFLLDKGLANSTIGIILALSNVASIIVQTFFANFTAKHKSVQLQDMLKFTLGVIIVASIIIFFAPTPLLFILAIIVAFSFAQSNTPFVNSLAFIYEDKGIEINYGIGRGFGSLAYALVNLFLGFIIQKTAPGILPILYIGIALAFIFIVRSYRLPENALPETFDDSLEATEENEVNEQTQAESKSISLEEQSFVGFLSKYRNLIFVILGLAFVLFAHSIISTYMIQIVTPIGGDSSSVGLAVFIAAGAEFPVMMNFDKLSKKRSAAFWLKCSMFFFILKIVILYFATNLFMVYLSQFLQFGAYALAYPAAVQYIKNAVDKKDLFKGQSLFTISTTMSAVFASLMGGILIDNFGVSTMLFIAFLVAGIGGGIIFATVDRVPQPEAKLAQAQN
jgi:PPP family 3-phenylpropionic acid transporter